MWCVRGSSCRRRRRGCWAVPRAMFCRLRRLGQDGGYVQVLTGVELRERHRRDRIGSGILGELPAVAVPG